MSDCPRVSIIVPIYNSEAFLPRILQDIKNQTFTDFECILVNDGSKDNSSRICHEFASADDRFRVIDKKNEGVSAARNTGLHESLGEFIAFVDSDDRINPRYLECLCQGIKENVDVVVCQRKIIHSHNCRIREIKNATIVTKSCDYSTYLTDKKIGFQVPTYVWGHLYRKSSISYEFRNPSEVGFEDCYFNIVNTSSFRKVSFVYVPLYYYLVRDNSLCKNKEAVYRNMILSANSLFEYCDSISDKENFSKLAPYVFQTVSAFAYLIFIFHLQRDQKFVYEYSKLIPDLDRYYSYWKQNKNQMQWFVYKVFWGSLFKFTKKRLLKK